MHPHEQTLAESKESAVIQDFTTNHENTSNQFVSNSVGMAVLALKENYYRTDTDIEAAYVNCVTELTAIKESKETPETLQSAIEHIINVTKQPLNSFDRVTLFISGKEQRYILPLKEVLPLVWMALHDHAKFVHHYAKEPDPLAAAKNDLPKRLENFFQCLKRMKTEAVCHHGNRNELVFLLNGTYEGIEIIEDDKTTVLAFLKDYINTLFWPKYERSSDKEKRTLAAALFKWMESNNPSQLLKQIDAKKNYRKKLSELFLRHGSNPKAIKKLVDDALTFLAFVCDRKEHRFIAEANDILNSIPEEESQTARDQALPFMQEWIKQQYDLNNKQFHDQITSFYHMDKARRLLSSNRLLLGIRDQMNDELRTLEENLTPYFERIKKNNETNEKIIPTITDEMLQRVEKLDRAIQKIKNDKMADEIENFFVHWFNARQVGNLEKLKRQYALLLNELFQKAIYLTDDDDKDDKLLEWIKSGISQEDETFFRNVTPYEINRIFLHAILKISEEKSELFFGVFKAALQFVKSNFNKPQSDRLAKTLKQDSYPPALLQQLDYLSNKYCPEESENKPAEPPQRPNGMLILPEQIRTFSDWQRISLLLSAEKLDQIYQIHFSLISKILRSEWTQGLESYRKVIDSIPFYKRNRFFKLYISDFYPLIKTAKNLYDLLEPFTYASFLKEVWLDFSIIIYNLEDLKFALQTMFYTDQLEFIEQAELNFEYIIQDAKDLCALLQLFKYTYGNISIIKKVCNFAKICKTGKELAEVSNYVMGLTLLDFVTEFNINITDLISKEEDLISILKFPWQNYPSKHINDFIKRFNFLTLVKSLRGFIALLNAVDLDEVIQLIREAKLDPTAVIKNARDLASVLVNLSNENRAIFIDQVNLNYAAMITNPLDLMLILATLPDYIQIDFLHKTGLDIQSIITNANSHDHNMILHLLTSNEWVSIDELASILGKPTDAEAIKIKDNVQELIKSHEHQAKLKSWVLRMPLYVVGDVIFNFFFSYVIGFEWFLKLSNLFVLPDDTYFVPSIKYKITCFPGATDKELVYDKHLLQAQSNLLTLKFFIDSDSYDINSVNWWTIPCIFIASHLGKILGWILVSPFILTANLLIKAYYAIKRAILDFKINNKPQELAGLYCENKYSLEITADRVAKHVSASDFLVGFVKYHRENIRQEIDYSLSECFNAKRYHYDHSLLGHYKNYSDAREKILVRERYWSLVKTILSGIFLLPLIFTIPAHKKLIFRQAEEKKLLNKNLIFLGRVSQIENKSYFEFGKLFRDLGRPDLAFYYFEKVAKISPMYREAMEYCRNYLYHLADKRDLADEYFKKAQDARAVNNTKMQAAPTAVATEPMPPEVKEVKAENAVASINSTQILRRVGVFADQSATRSPEISASDDERYEMSLSDSDDGAAQRPRA